MAVWLLSVLGTGITGALVTHLTSKLRMHAIVRTACVYAFILSVVLPLPVMLSGEADAGSCGTAGFETEYDEGIADVTDAAYFSLVAEALDNELSASGYDTQSVIEGSVFGEKAVVEKITITVSGEFPDSSVVILRIKELAAEYLETDGAVIDVYVE